MPPVVYRATEIESDFVAETTIRVLEGVPSRRVYRYQRDTNGTLADLDLTTATDVVLTIKKYPSTDDADARVVHRASDADGVVTISEPVTWGKIEFQFPISDTVEPGHFFYRVDVSFPEGPRTIGYGPFIVENT